MKETLTGSPSKSSAANSTSVFAPQRVASVDVYRGFVMLLMMAEVLSLRHVSESFPASTFWRILYFNQDHVPWVGCSLHDLIQPSFSFLVGVALPYSIASRKSKGSSFGTLLGADDKKANDEKDKTTTADSKDDKQKDSDGAIRGKKLK